MAAWTTTPRTWSVGETVTAANMNAQIRDFANAFGAWASYTVAWGSSGTAPAIGNGTIAGAYSQVQKTVMFRAQMTTGSTSTYGTGAYSITLPPTQSTGQTQVGQAVAFDTSATFYYRGALLLFGAGTVRTQFVDGAASTAGWNSSVPFTWATGDMASFSGTYEAS